MPIQVSESNVYQKLSTVKHPEMPKRSLVELNMIPDVRIEGDHVLVELALPFMNVPTKQDVINLIQNAVSNMKGNPEVKVKITEMNAKQRSKFMAYSQKENVASQRPGQQQGNVAKQTPKPSNKIDKVLAVMSGKGGVGKSSVAGLLASSLRRQGLEIGVLDADITGPSIPMMFGAQHRPMQTQEGILPVESRTGIKLMSINLLLPDQNQPVVWRGPLISKAIEQFWGDIVWGDLDYLVVDLPPGTADAALTVMQSLPLDGIVLVTSPQDLAGMIVHKAAIMAQNIGVPLVGLVENMSYLICPDCGKQINIFGNSTSAETAKNIGTAMLGNLPIDPQFSELCDKGAIEDYQSDAFEDVTDKVLEFVSSK
ncbi:MAG: Mrp/NBP35 family ATP-binding protein [Chloroflexota bacterium]|nr:Mrp/NBP35 family ATP-binding protein [Chloroflexota bacterium]